MAHNVIRHKTHIVRCLLPILGRWVVFGSCRIGVKYYQGKAGRGEGGRGELHSEWVGTILTLVDTIGLLQIISVPSLFLYNPPFPTSPLSPL